ncbi:MAG: PASTA domain-containing protein [Paramuribaculum sp.]|nr:PASTA domain-containing protein [Paramuribaculum sp.]
MDTPEPKKTLKLWHKVTLHLLIMFAAAVIIVFALIFWLDVWTHHGERIMVPRLIGMSYEDACKTIDDSDFRIVLQDSIYDSKAFPGQVLDQNPKDSTYVKEGRTIFVTINAFYARMVAVPNLKDISLRQAVTTLEGLGLKNYVIKEVPSQYNNLVLSVSYNGKHLLPGTKLPLSAKLVIEVGKGANESALIPDTLLTIDQEPVKITDGNADAASEQSETGQSPTTAPIAPTPDTDPDYFD